MPYQAPCHLTALCTFGTWRVTTVSTRRSRAVCHSGRRSIQACAASFAGSSASSTARGRRRIIAVPGGRVVASWTEPISLPIIHGPIWRQYVQGHSSSRNQDGQRTGRAEDRRGARTRLCGARAVLGMARAVPPASPRQGQGDSFGGTDDDGKIPGISKAGATWIERNGLTSDKLEEHFHVEDGKGTLIGDPIGDGKREQSINTYLLTGVAALLGTGKAEFTDKTARENCTQLGCYDSPNHSNTVSQLGNKVTGSKKAGWKLTAPGLSAAAALLKPQDQKAK